MGLALLLTACLPEGELWQSKARGPAIKHWAVYYNDVLPAEEFLPYDLLVFDDAAHPPLHHLKTPERLLLGYVSFGESGASRPFAVHDTPGIKLKENPSWPGNFILDARKPEWKKFLIETHIPSILAQGFDGIFIDTLDSPLFLALSQPEKYPGLYEALVELLKETRRAFPDIVIALNRGFDVDEGYTILPDVAREIDFLLVESSLTDHDFESKKQHFQPVENYQRVLKFVKQAQQENPALKVLSLDYWDPQDSCGVKRIYETQRRQGFIPQVSTLALDTLYPEPASCL